MKILLNRPSRENWPSGARRHFVPIRKKVGKADPWLDRAAESGGLIPGGREWTHFYQFRPISPTRPWFFLDRVSIDTADRNCEGKEKSVRRIKDRPPGYYCIREGTASYSARRKIRLLELRVRIYEAIIQTGTPNRAARDERISILFFLRGGSRSFRTRSVGTKRRLRAFTLVSLRRHAGIDPRRAYHAPLIPPGDWIPPLASLLLAFLIFAVGNAP